MFWGEILQILGVGGRGSVGVVDLNQNSSIVHDISIALFNLPLEKTEMGREESYVNSLSNLTWQLLLC